MENEVVKVDGNPYLPMIKMIVEQKGDLVQLEKFMDLQQRWEADQALKVYNKAFISAQLKIDTIVKGEFNKHTNSQYENLTQVIEGAKPVYSAEGFAVIFYEGDAKKDTDIRIMADVVHENGHKETYHYDVPIDGTGIKGNSNMTGIQGKASSVAYGRRTLMKMIWNIATKDDEDKDGNGKEKSKRLTDIEQMDHVKKIQDCKTKGELVSAYNYAIGQADILKDTESQLMFVAEKDNKLKKLNEQVKK